MAVLGEHEDALNSRMSSMKSLGGESFMALGKEIAWFMFEKLVAVHRIE